MSLGEMWSLLIGTLLGLGVLVGVFLLKRYLRVRLLPGSQREAQGQAMAELLALQARLQGQGRDVPGVAGDGGEKETSS